jgi:GWT1
VIYLGGNMLVTCLAILAVDFRIFPRRFAKTETFGISLMDIGVGTFIVSSAVTSRYARGQYPPRITKENNNNNNGNEKNENENENNNNEKKSKNNFSFSEFCRIFQLFFHLQTQNWKHYLVLVLGLGRMIALKVFNYHENVSEYGVHWNFFVTLFSIWQISDFLHRFLSRKFLPWFAIAILLLYQFTLSKTTMTDFIFAASRKNFFYANREGFLSLFGYVPMYLLVEMLAHHFFYNCENENENENDNNNDNEHENINEHEVNYENENEDSINMNIETNYNNNNSNDDNSNYNYINSSSSKESNSNNNEESETNNDEIGNDENDFINYNNNIRNSPSIGENRPGSNIGKNDSGKFRKTDFSLPEKPKKNSIFFSFRTTDSTHSDKERDKECSSTLFLSPHSPNNNNNNNQNNQNNQNNLNYRKNVLHYPYFKDKIGNKSQRHFYRQLSVIIAVLWTAWLASTSVQQTSRRLANLAYVSLVLALSFTLILLIAVADSMGDLVLSYKGSQLNNINNNNHSNNSHNTLNTDSNNNNENKSIHVNDNTNIDEMNTKSFKIDLPQHPAIPLTIKTLECLNEFQLPVFLVANVMTGVINMTIKTIYSSHIFAFFILSTYAMTFIGFAWIVSEKLKKK